jgi:hypothetical protein
MEADDFDFGDRNFLKLEALLASKRPRADDVWGHRVSLFSSIASTPYVSQGKKFKLGLVSYLAWAFSRILTKRPPRTDKILPEADFLVNILGAISKETDTLVPVASALHKAGYSVLVIWGTSAIPDEIVGELKGVTLWIPPPDLEFAGPRWLIVKDLLSVGHLYFRAAFYLRSLNGSWAAFHKRGATWFHHLFYLKRWERFFTSALEHHDFKGIAVASENAYSALALCRVAIKRRWPIHHFWHGLAGVIINTRCIATHLHCFSSADRNFFIKHNWPVERVHATGHPRQERLIAQISKLRTTAPIEGGLRVLFASQPGWSGDFGLQQSRDTMEAVLQSARILGLTADELRVRLHPAESPGTYFDLANKYVPKLSSSLLSTRSVAEDLAWANVLITAFSTMSIEASYAGSFLIWLVVGNFFTEVGEELVRHGYGYKASSAKHLSEMLEKCRDPNRRSQLILDFIADARTLDVINDNAAASAAQTMIAQAATAP